jgi:hypothetical protein
MPENPVLECPKCRKHGLVRLHSESDIFECVYCHYKDDLTKEAEAKPFSGGMLWAALLAIFIVLVMAG